MYRRNRLHFARLTQFENTPSILMAETAYYYRLLKALFGHNQIKQYVKFPEMNQSIWIFSEKALFPERGLPLANVVWLVNYLLVGRPKSEDGSCNSELRTRNSEPTYNQERSTS